MVMNDMGLLTELSLFSGAGGGLLGTTHLLGWKTVCYVEWDKYAIEILKARIKDGYLHDAPIWDNVFTFDGRPWAGCVDVVSAGFPCQPFSVAGKGMAEDDPRNGWPATLRIIREVRPVYAKLENVPGLISKPYFRTILGELSEAGFSFEWDCISAAEVGANHKRERVWIVAYSESNREWRMAMEREQNKEDAHAHGKGSSVEPCGFCGYEFDHELLGKYGCPNCEGDVPNPKRNGRKGSGKKRESEGSTGLRGGTRGDKIKEISNPIGERLRERRQSDDLTAPSRDDHAGREEADGDGAWWAAEPELGRVANGVAHRVDRLRAIGNGQVPAVVREAWRRLG